MHRPSNCLMALALLAVAPVPAQNGPARSGPRRLLPPLAEIALARSAAPPAGSAGSRVWVFTGSAYVIGDSGTSGVNCYVGRPWSGSLEPHCFDPEGSATILPIQIRRVERYAAGRSESEVETEIARGILAGTFRLPSRPAMTYMMSAAQNLITENGTAVGAWQAHLMIYGGGGVMLIENPGQLEHFVPAPDSAKR